jgi:phosphoribosylaminoimidazole-succinocarboxamide synthase
MKLEDGQQIFEKYSNIKSHENPSSGSRVVPCRRTDMTKLTVIFRNFANGPKEDTFIATS